VLNAPRHGSLVVFADGSARYTHDGSETVQDDFIYQLRDAAGALSNAATVRFTVTPVDDAPTVTLAPLAITSRQALLLDPTLVQAADSDSATATLSYVVTEATHGQFEWVFAPGTAIQQFTPTDVAAGQVRFVSTDSADAPTFALAAFDGVSRGAEVHALVTFNRVDGGQPGAPAAEPDSGSGTTAPLPGTPAPPADGRPAVAAESGEAGRADEVAPADPAVTTPAGQGISLSEAVLAGLAPDATATRQTPWTVAATPSRSRGADDALELAERVAVEDADLAVQLLALATPADIRPSARSGSAEVELPAVQAWNDADSPALSLANAARAGGLALTAGTVWWALRAGGLATSLLASLPAWQNADLLAVLPDDDDEDPWDPAEDAEAERDEQAAGDVFGLVPEEGETR
jgi:hypothetical protein